MQTVVACMGASVQRMRWTSLEPPSERLRQNGGWWVQVDNMNRNWRATDAGCRVVSGAVLWMVGGGGGWWWRVKDGVW